jgi:hypothetical protein
VSRAQRTKATDGAARITAMWEEAASRAAATYASDPRALAVGAGLMRAHLLWGRAMQLAWEATWAPVEALAGAAGDR